MEKQVIKLLKIAIKTKQQADINAFAGQVWVTHFDFIYTKIKGIIGQYDENFADEIMSSFFAKKIISPNYKNFPTDSIHSFKRVLAIAVKNHCKELLSRRHKKAKRTVTIDKAINIESDKQQQFINTTLKTFIKTLNFKQQTLIWLRLAGINYDRLATIYQCSSGALRDRFSRIKNTIQNGQYKTRLNFRDKQKVEAFLDEIDNEEVSCFIQAIYFRKQDSTEIIDEWEKLGKNSRMTILRSIVYLQRHIRKAA